MEKQIEIVIILLINIKQYQNESLSRISKVYSFKSNKSIIQFLFLRSERVKSRSPIDKEVERVTSDLLDRIIPKDEPTTTGNALSLLQNFVIKQTPSTTLLNTLNPHTQIDLNNNCDDENSNQSMTNSSDEKLSSSSSSNQTKSNESPLASLEKMLAYPTTTTQSPTSSINDNGPKKKKFDKYRLFAEKMLRSTLS